MQQNRRKNVGKGIRGKAIWIKADSEVAVEVCLKEGMFFVYPDGGGKSLVTLDLLVFVVVPSPEKFTLLFGDEEYTFRPLSDLLSSWLFRLEQSSLHIQTQAVTTAGKEFLSIVRRLKPDGPHSHRYCRPQSIPRM